MNIFEILEKNTYRVTAQLFISRARLYSYFWLVNFERTNYYHFLKYKTRGRRLLYALSDEVFNLSLYCDQTVQSLSEMSRKWQGDFEKNLYRKILEDIESMNCDLQKAYKTRLSTDDYETMAEHEVVQCLEKLSEFIDLSAKCCRTGELTAINRRELISVLIPITTQFVIIGTLCRECGKYVLPDSIKKSA